MTSFGGGATVGWVNASGIVSLDISKDRLRLSILAIGTYEFRPEDVVAIELKKRLLFSGVRIRHAVAKYPASIVFQPMNASGVIDAIRTAGFIPSAPAPLPPRPVAFRWGVALGALGIYVALLTPYTVSFFRAFLRMAPADLGELTGWPTLTALGFGFAFAWGLRLGPLRPVVLKPGRDFEEIKHWVHLLCLIFTLLLPIFAFITLVVSPRMRL